MSSSDFTLSALPVKAAPPVGRAYVSINRSSADAALTAAAGAWTAIPTDASSVVNSLGNLGVVPNATPLTTQGHTINLYGGKKYRITGRMTFSGTVGSFATRLYDTTAAAAATTGSAGTLAASSSGDSQIDVEYAPTTNVTLVWQYYCTAASTLGVVPVAGMGTCVLAALSVEVVA